MKSWAWPTTSAKPSPRRRSPPDKSCPPQGIVFISVTDHDKPGVADVARRFVDMGFKLVATAGTADVLEDAGMTVERVYKVKEGRPNVVDLIKGERIHLIINTPHGADPWFDEKAIRRAAVTARIPTITTLVGCPRRGRRHRRLATRRGAGAGAAASARRTDQLAIVSENLVGVGLT